MTGPVGGSPRHYVVLPDGLQEVPPMPAELLRVASGAATPTAVGPDVLAGAALVEDLAVADWPAAAPRLLEPANVPVLCWTWTVDGDSTGGVAALLVGLVG